MAEKEYELTEAVLILLGAVASFILFLFGGWAWCGYVTMKLWNWFVPGLTGGPTINMWWALGIAAFVGSFLPEGYNKPDPNATPGQKWMKIATTTFIRPAFYLLFGWMVSGHLTPLR